MSGYYEVVNDNAQSEGESWNTWNYGGTGNTNALFAGTLQYSGYYTFTIDSSGPCINAPSTGSGVQLVQSTCDGTPAQAFSLTQ